MVQNTTTLSNNLHSYYFKLLLEEAEKKLVMVGLGKKMLHPRKTGKDSYVLRYGHIAEDLSTLGEGVTPTASSLKTNKYTISMNQYGKYIPITDFLVSTAIDPVMEDHVKELSYDAAKTADSIVRNVVIAGATTDIQYVGAGIVADAAITATDVFVAQDSIKAVRVLKGQDAPAMDDGYFTWVVHPLISMDIQSDTSAGGFIELNKYVAGLAEKPLKGEVGKVYGARVVESSNISAVANATPINVYRSLMFAKNAFAFTSFDSDFVELITKQQGSGGSSDPLNQIATVGYKMQFGCTYIGGTFTGEEGSSPDLCIQIRGAATGG
jgi:N4-gp56 family major capsid protein